MALIKKKERCVLCNAVVDKDAVELKFEAPDDASGEMQEHDIGKICTRCADVLDSLEMTSGYEADD